MDAIDRVFLMSSDTPTTTAARSGAERRRRLFRPEVSETNSETWLGDIRLAEPISHRVWAIGATVSLVALVLWMTLGEYTRRERVQGVLVPVDGYARIKARGPGEVRAIRVHEGDVVKKGQVLIEIDADRYADGGKGVAEDVAATIEQEKRTLREDIAGSRLAAQRRRTELLAQIDLVREQMVHNQQMLDIYREEARAQAELLDKVEPALKDGYVSATQVQQLRTASAAANATVARQLTERSALEQKLRDLQGQLTREAHESNVRINDSLRQLARSDAAFDKNEADRGLIVRAPVDGVVSSIFVYAGQSVNNGSSLATVVSPDVRLEAELLVASAAVGFVRPGSEVAIQYHAYPFQKFGVHKGKVRYVSSNALSPSEIAEITGRNDISEPMYRVRASLGRQTIRVYGEDKRLAPGMAINGGIMIDRRRIYEWIFEPLYTLRKDSGGGQ